MNLDKYWWLDYTIRINNAVGGDYSSIGPYTQHDDRGVIHITVNNVLDKYELITNDNAAIIKDRLTGDKIVCKRAKDEPINPELGALYALARMVTGCTTKEINEWIANASHHGKRD